MTSPSIEPAASTVPLDEAERRRVQQRTLTVVVISQVLGGAGLAAGGIGAIGVVTAAVSDNVPLLFAAVFIYGAGTATNLHARYAGTDLAPPARRGTAISIAMVSTTLGAVAGPNLVDPLGELATRMGVPALAGPFLLAAVAYSAAGVALFALLRPDPFLLARRLGAGGGAMSGVVVSASDYATLSLAGGALALLLIPVLFWARRDQSTPARTAA